MDHELYMQRCLELAENGLGNTSPNPMVGSVVVHDGRIIGEGWHRKAGEAHAEVNAINSVKDQALLNDSTLYVNLEPCAHHGKTPPCSDLIIEKGIPRVVVGIRDPFSEVDGKGIEKMQKAGIEVTVGILENECRWLNRRFFCLHQNKRPYIILKWAQSQDGFLDRERHTKDRGINWITTSETRSLVHLWRSQEDAIMVGGQTVINDNPSLTVRDIEGKEPTRIILNQGLEIPENSNVFDGAAPTLYFTDRELNKSNLSQFALRNENQLQQVLEEAYQQNIQSILVEGGAQLLKSFIDMNLWDEARVLTGQPSFGNGLRAPRIKSPAGEIQSFGKDQLKLYYR